MAKLSRLEVTPEEETVFCGQFESILGHMDILNKVDTEGVEPMYSTAWWPGATRDDAALRIRSREDILANAPETNGEAFVLPRIV